MRQFIRLSLIAAAAVVFAAPPSYHVITKIKIGGAGRWDYAFADGANHRLYVSHATQTEAIDTTTDKPTGAIPNTTGVHGIAVADNLGRGFTSNGQTNNVTIFDLKTLKVLGTVNTGQNPDAIIYEPSTRHVFTLNGRSGDSTAFDAKSGEVVAASIPLGGKPEFAQVDGKGRVFVNIEDKNEIVVLDAKANTVTSRYSIAPCDSPSGLAFDAKKMRLFSVCENRVMIVSDPAAGKVIASVPIGAGDDGVAFDDGYAFAANGQDGTITMVGETSPGKYEALATIPTQRSARTIAADQRAHKLYLPAAEYPATPQNAEKKGRPTPIPDSFQVIVLGR
jgi:DNA-binding beta-propeller fold protein YncE